MPPLSSPAAELVRTLWSEKPVAGIVLGTGSGQLASQIQVDVAIPYAKLPHFPNSTATGHRGQWLCGHLDGHPVVAMQGRFHLYEGYSSSQSTIGIHLFQQLGVRGVILTNASGGIHPLYRSGEIMALSSHLDFMFTRNQSPSDSHRPSNPPDDTYSEWLLERARRCARHQGFPLHVGTYVAMLGPNYETRAEYRWLRRIGGDVVGMSTIPEVNVAARYHLPVLALSIVANVARPDQLDPTSGQEVIDAAQVAGPHLAYLIRDAVQAIASRSSAPGR